MTDLVKEALGPVNLDLALENGKVKLMVGSDKLSGVDMELSVLVDAKLFLDKLKGLIPGEIDDAIITALEAAFLK